MPYFRITNLPKQKPHLVPRSRERHGWITFEVFQKIRRLRLRNGVPFSRRSHAPPVEDDEDHWFVIICHKQIYTDGYRFSRITDVRTRYTIHIVRYNLIVNRSVLN